MSAACEILVLESFPNLHVITPLPTSAEDLETYRNFRGWIPVVGAAEARRIFLENGFWEAVERGREMYFATTM
jgi:hypothetical protein